MNMPGSSFGRILKVATYGESHGPGIGALVEGVPPGFAITEADIQCELDRRRPGQSKVTTPRKESDKVEILSGVFEGKSTGAPISLLIRNTNQKSKDYSHLKKVFRPGHADYTFQMKYGIRDYRGGGRSSGRETACRVAAGAIAKKWLSEQGVTIHAYTKEIAGIRSETVDYNCIEQNMVRSPDPIAATAMIEAIERARSEGDSLGGIVEAVIEGCPVGLGDPVFDKLDALLSYALMSIGTIKGVEFGAGFSVSGMKGSECNDAFISDSDQIATKTNHAGGILGGISSGNPIELRVAVKPPSSISIKQETVDIHQKEQQLEVKGRHDPCICPRVVPVVEAMIALVLMDASLIQKTISNT